jgi:SAM-dependent methyltransferase
MTLTSPFQQPVRPGSAACAARLTGAVSLVGGVKGGLRSGLLEALWRWQPCTAAELATRIHLSQRAVEVTLAALAVGGVVVESEHVDDDTDSPRDDAHGSDWALTAPPETWALLVGFEENICRFVETGTATRADADDRYTGVLPVIGRFHDAMAEQVAPLLARRGARVLELGAGTAPWSRALLAADPTITAVAVDLPPVISHLARTLRGSALAPRVELVAQDVRSLALAERFDVIVVSGLCRLLSESDNAQLFVRCLGLLAPHGRVVICDSFAGSDDHDGSLALYTLGLAARSHAEALWSAADYERWLDRAGFTTAAIVLAERPGLTALIASTAPQPHLLGLSEPFVTTISTPIDNEDRS